MINLPQSLTDLALLKRLKAGCVIKTLAQFPDDATALKRLNVMTNQHHELLLAVTTTSQIRNKRYHYGKDDIFLNATQEPIFERDTYVQLGRVIEFKIELLKKRYALGELEILGNISEKLLDRLYQQIEISELLKQKDIKRILSERI